MAGAAALQVAIAADCQLRQPHSQTVVSLDVCYAKHNSGFHCHSDLICPSHLRLHAWKEGRKPQRVDSCAGPAIGSGRVAQRHNVKHPVTLVGIGQAVGVHLTLVVAPALPKGSSGGWLRVADGSRRGGCSRGHSRASVSPRHQCQCRSPTCCCPGYQSCQTHPTRAPSSQLHRVWIEGRMTLWREQWCRSSIASSIPWLRTQPSLTWHSKRH